ncbi:MAG: substrate-binding domain-containing protein [Planctomycetota bacterium]
MRLGLWILTLSILTLVSSTTRADTAVPTGAVSLDPNLPYYRPVENLSGELKLGGSNTLSHIAAGWIDSFTQFYPNVRISIEVNGSRQAVRDVEAGKTHIGLLSRTVHREEVEAFQQKFGYPPTVLTPCLERTGVFVHKDNPIEGLTLSQLDSIYSPECRRGSDKPCGTWAYFGVTGDWGKRSVVAHGRTKDTGSQVFIQQAVMLGAPLREDLIAHKSNVDLIKAIAADPNAVGFCGLSYATPEVKAVPLGFSKEEGFVKIDSPEADRGLYPLIRRLQLVVNHDPSAELPALQQEFIKYVFSRLGQEDVVKAGFQAIPARPAHIALDAVGLGISR